MYNHIGSDSQNVGKSTKYATVIAYRFGSRGCNILSKSRSIDYGYVDPISR